MSTLSNRLKMLYDMIPACDTLADVGCDHAYISIEATKNMLCKRAFAMDVRSGPLEKAKINIKEAGLEDRIHTVLSDGLLNAPDEVLDVILISGMGGILMDGILDQGRIHLSSNKCLLLQPQSDMLLVRHRLHELGYVIKSERALVEGGKYYFAICAVPGKVEIYSQEFMYHFGKCLLDEKDETLLEYLDYRLNKGLERLNIAREKDQSACPEGIINEIDLCKEAIAYINA